MRRLRVWWMIVAAIVVLVSAGCGSSTGAEVMSTSAAEPAAPVATSAPVQAFAPGPELPNSGDVAKAIADSVNVPEWPPEPAVGSYPFNSEACFNGVDAATGKLPCDYGDPKGTHTMVVYGDSHAGMWVPMLAVIAEHKGWRFEQLTLQSCAPAEYPVYNPRTKNRFTECDDFREDSLTRIKELKPDVVLISGQRRNNWAEKDGRPDKDGTTEAWAKGLAVTIDRLKEVAGRVIIIGDIAYSEQDPVDCMTSNPDDVRKCNTDRSYAELKDHNLMEKRVAAENGADYIDTVQWMCTDTTCPAVVAGMTTHRNRTHVSVTYTLWLRGVFTEAAGLNS